MKKWMMLCALLLIGGALPAAEKIFEINQKYEILMPRSRLLEMTGVTFERFVGYHFAAQNAYLRLDVLDKTPADVTVAVTASQPEPPTRDQLILLRPGFHNTLLVNKKGELVLNLWEQDPATGKFSNLKLVSRRTVRPGNGRYFRGAFTVARGADGKSTVKLYLDGALEAERTVGGKLFGYSRTFCIGGAPEEVAGKINSFDGVIRSFCFYDGVLGDDEIASLR